MGGLSNYMAPTVPLISVDNGGFAVFYIYSSPYNVPFLFNGNEVGGVVGYTIQWENDSTEAPLTSSLMFGTVIPIPMSSPANIPYVANPTYWAGSPPTTVQEALDRIAAVVGNPTPIP